jgi:integrase/recombinase XerC
VRLNVADIEMEQKTMMVTGKGADDQELVDLHPNSSEALEKYLKTTKKKSGALFTSDSKHYRK